MWFWLVLSFYVGAVFAWFMFALFGANKNSERVDSSLPIEMLQEMSTDYIHHGIRKTDDELRGIAHKYGYEVKEE